MEKKKLVIGNWKLNPESIARARVLLSRIEHGLHILDRKKADTAVCPPFVFLSVAKAMTHFSALGAQNVSAEKEGAFTGEISARQLREFGVKYVLVGHSERRDMGEKDKEINEKIKRVLEEEMTPVLCVGHGSTRSDSKATLKAKLNSQLNKAFENQRSKKSRVVVAYEPVWAISKGATGHKAATPEHAAEICEFISTKYKVQQVIYGGSVNHMNARQFADAGIAGALPGGASLDAEKFLEIVKAFGK